MKKKLIISIMLLTLSFCVFGQNATVSSDSVVVPTKWLRDGMRDLIRYDQLKEKDSVLQLSNTNLKSMNQKLTDFNSDLQKQREDMRLRWQEAIKAGEISNKQAAQNIQDLNKIIHKQRMKSTLSTIFGTIGGAAVGILIGVFLIK